MPTVVDALIVTLGLDPTDFSKGQKQAVKDLLATQKHARSVAKDMSESGKKAAAFFGQMRTQVLLLFAAFTGGRGLKSFIEDVAASSAAVGRTALVLGTTTQELSKWQGAVRSVGGSAAGTAASMASLDRVLTNIALVPGSATGILPYLNALNVSLVGADGKVLKVGEALVRLNRATQGMDKRQASSILAGIGLDPSQIQLVLKSSKEFDAILKHSSLYSTTPGEAAAGQRISTGIDTLTQGFEKLGRIIMEWLEPSITRFNARLEKMILWLKSHPEELKQIFAAVAAGVVLIGVALGGPIAGFTALGIAIAALYSDWETYNETGKSDFSDFYKYVEDGWKRIRTTAIEAWDSIKDVALPYIKLMKDQFVGAFTIINDAVKLWYHLFFGSMSDIKADWKKLTGDLTKYWDDLWEDMTKLITAAAPRIQAAIKHAFGSAFDWAIKRVNVVREALGLKPLKNFGETSGDETKSTSNEPPSEYESRVMTPNDAKAAAFIAEHLGTAKIISAETGIPVERILGQAGVETGWSLDPKHSPQHNSFGLHTYAGYTGKRQNVMMSDGKMHEIQAFDNKMEAWRSWAKVMRQPNFKSANAPGLSDAEYAGIVARGGYAAEKGYDGLLMNSFTTTRRILNGGGIVKKPSAFDVFKPNSIEPSMTLGAAGSAGTFASNDNRRGPITVQIGDIHVTARTNDPKAYGAAVAEETYRRTAALINVGLTG